MFGQNPIAANVNNETGERLRVVKGSPFPTIQGEGPYAGCPATFIRLHGCNLRCFFCDTQFSDPEDPEVGIEDLVMNCQTLGNGLVVITGGEPFRQNILPLCMMLRRMGFGVQIETAGTLWVPGIEKYAEIVVSPKTAVIHPAIKQYATAYKYVISADDTHEGFLPVTATQPGARPQRLAAPPGTGVSVFLSPMDQCDPIKNAANLKLVAELAMRHHVIAGVQLHKLFGID